jgi:hypothetical protein
MLFQGAAASYTGRLKDGRPWVTMSSTAELFMPSYRFLMYCAAFSSALGSQRTQSSTPCGGSVMHSGSLNEHQCNDHNMRGAAGHAALVAQQSRRQADDQRPADVANGVIYCDSDLCGGQTLSMTMSYGL